MRLIGIGIDLVEIDRIKCIISSDIGDRFLKKLFSAEERAIFDSNSCPEQTIAANFAAKEALAKAIGTGFNGITPADVSVLRDSSGKPYIELSGKTALKIRADEFEVSHTHTATTAGAVVAALTAEDCR